MKAVKNLILFLIFFKEILFLVLILYEVTKVKNFIIVENLIMTIDDSVVAPSKFYHQLLGQLSFSDCIHGAYQVLINPVNGL